MQIYYRTSSRAPWQPLDVKSTRRAQVLALTADIADAHEHLARQRASDQATAAIPGWTVV